MANNFRDPNPGLAPTETAPSYAPVSEDFYAIPEAAQQTEVRIYEPGTIGEAWQNSYFH